VKAGRLRLRSPRESAQRRSRSRSRDALRLHESRIAQGELVSIVVGTALFRRSAELVEGAVGTPGLGVEACRAGNREHVAVSAALRPVFRRTPPTARLEAADGRRDGRGFHRLRRRPVRNCRCRQGIGHAYLQHSRRMPTDFSRTARSWRSSGATSVTAWPASSARPVRPTRWT